MPVNGFDNAKNKAAVYTKTEMDPSITTWDNHVGDSTIHVTAEDKTYWNGKISPDSGTGLISKNDLPPDTLYSDAAGRLDVDQAPLLGAWENYSHAWTGHGQQYAEFSTAVSYARATVIINAGTAHIWAQYDRARGTLYGIRLDGSTWTFGDVTGTISGGGAQTMTLAAGVGTITFTKSDPSLTTQPADVTMLIRQDA